MGGKIYVEGVKFEILNCVLSLIWMDENFRE